MQSEYSSESIKELLTVKGAASLLEVSKSSVYRYIKEGLISSYRFAGKTYLKRSEILAAVEAGKETIEETAVQEAA